MTGGVATIAEAELRPGNLLYLPPGRHEVRLVAPEGTVIMLLGGVPLGERLLMWWNFVARTPQEIQAAVADWEEGRFGAVGDYAGDPLAAPALNVARLIARS